jgi:sulfate/thiosulfate transport system permease protein
MLGAEKALHAFRLEAPTLVTLPAIRSGVAYGVVLTMARAIGEFGAVAIVSGKLSGLTETLTIYVETSFERFDLVGCYTAAVVLALIAIGTLLLTNLTSPKEEY